MKTISESLRESSEWSIQRGAAGVVIQDKTALAIADMLDHAWHFGSPETRLYFANRDQGYAEKMIAERQRAL